MPVELVRIEMKVCEFCARNFARLAGSGLKYCGKCAAELATPTEPPKPTRLAELNQGDWEGRRRQGRHNRRK